MLNFLLGSMFGGTVGFLTFCFCWAAKTGDAGLDDQMDY